MNLDKTKIRTFRDLCEAFVQQYQYNVDMASDWSDFQAITQGNGETFKEYAQSWRDAAAQVSPRIEEKEMTKLFLKTLNQFYYERMVGSAPKNFAEMVVKENRNVFRIKQRIKKLRFSFLGSLRINTSISDSIVTSKCGIWKLKLESRSQQSKQQAAEPLTSPHEPCSSKTRC